MAKSPSLTVVQILPALDAGGVERGTLEVAQALVSAGHRSIVISAGGRLVKELEAAGSQHITLAIGEKSLFTFRHITSLRKLFVNINPDIVHARSRLPAWLSFLTVKLLPENQRPHFITTVHGLYSVNRYSKIMTRGEWVIAVSDTAKNYIQNNYPDVDAQRIQVIHRGVDSKQFPYHYQPDQTWLTAWQQCYPQLKGKEILVLSGRLTRLKGHHDFIELMQRLKAARPQAMGLIVGGEDPKRKAYAAELYQRVKQLQLDNIIFTGHRSDMKEIYSQANIVLSLSSKPESFGRTAVEALSLGIPVIGYDHGGIGEILANCFPNGLVPLHDIDQLTNKVEDLLTSPAVINNSQPYTLSAMLNKTLALYQDLASRPGFEKETK